MSQAGWDALTQARVIVECPHDGTQLYSRFTVVDGASFTDDLGEGENWWHEWVGDFDARAVAATPEGGDQHWRTVLDCGVCRRAGREYRVILRLDTILSTLDPILEACHPVGATYRIADIHELLRRAARPD